MCSWGDDPWRDVRPWHGGARFGQTGTSLTPLCDHLCSHLILSLVLASKGLSIGLGHFFDILHVEHQ